MRRRRLGQHYLVNRRVVHRIVSLADIRPSERVLEIGTGRGAITKEVAGLGASFVGYEVDGRNYEETCRIVEGANARIVHADAFDDRPDFDVLVASLPYSESGRFVQWLSGITFSRAVVVLQEDFARKLLAPPGARDYRGVSALAQLCFRARVVDHVSRDSFSPQPKVSSVIVLLEPRLKVTTAEISDVVRLFSLRRRRVDSALADLGMESRESFGQRRVVSLTPDEVHRLCRPAGVR